MQKILEEVPEIKILENKLNLSKNITSPLDAVIEHLENATSIVGMAKKKAPAKNASSNSSKDSNKSKDAKKKTDNATVTKKDDGKKVDAPGAGVADKKDAAKDEKKDEKKEETAKAMQVSKPSAIIDASPISTVVISKG